MTLRLRVDEHGSLDSVISFIKPPPLSPEPGGLKKKQSKKKTTLFSRTTISFRKTVRSRTVSSGTALLSPFTHRNSLNYFGADFTSS